MSEYKVVTIMNKYKIKYFDDVVDIDDYIEKNGEFISNSEIVDILNEQEETIRKQNQEISACYDTLTTILEYVDAILNGLDIQDLFIKDYFQIIKNCDFDRMNKIIMELNSSGD